MKWRLETHRKGQPILSLKNIVNMAILKINVCLSTTFVICDQMKTLIIYPEV